jgi:alkylation response protein AidB-like acyl-CoA dehydrogenase
MRVPQKYGSLGLDLVTPCLLVEEVAQKCPATTMGSKMHREAVEAIRHRPTASQRQRSLEPRLRGEVFAAPGGEQHGQNRP